MAVRPAANERFVGHAFPEKQVDLGEIVMNYAEAGDPDRPAVVLVPQQTGSWWSYEGAMQRLAADFHVFAVDLRGQGRSDWTPGRYSLDNFGNDLVRFIGLVVGRPVLVAGNSSGGVLAAWLSAYALPGQVRAVLCEDPPLFASETEPVVGPSIREGAAGSLFGLYRTYLGEQWAIGDWDGLRRAAAASPWPSARALVPDEIPQHLLEYDPGWAGAFVDGTVARNCPHHVMLARASTPVLLTHHQRAIDPGTGLFVGALSDEQAAEALRLMRSAGVRADYTSLPDAPHVLHQADPDRYAAILTGWASTLPG